MITISSEVHKKNYNSQHLWWLSGSSIGHGDDEWGASELVTNSWSNVLQRRSRLAYSWWKGTEMLYEILWLVSSYWRQLSELLYCRVLSNMLCQGWNDLAGLPHAWCADDAVVTSMTMLGCTANLSNHKWLCCHLQTPSWVEPSAQLALALRHWDVGLCWTWCPRALYIWK